MKKRISLSKLIVTTLCIAVIIGTFNTAHAVTYKEVLIEASTTQYTPWENYDPGQTNNDMIWWYMCRGWHFHPSYGYEACKDSYCDGRPTNMDWKYGEFYTTFPPEAYIPLPRNTTGFTLLKMANLKWVEVEVDKYQFRRRLAIRGDLWGVELDEHTVSYKWSGKTPSNVGNPPTTETVGGGTKYTVPNVWIPAGWMFNGWKGSGITVNNGGSFTMPSENVELVGTWSPRTDIKYKVNLYKKQ